MNSSSTPSLSWGTESASSSSTTDAENPPCVLINGVPLDWSGRGTSHVDFGRREEPPLKQGRYLGYGVNGIVYETTCGGHSLAWKRKLCRTRIGRRERQEIEIIKRLSHKHIISLVGTYTKPPFLGLLLWPVATCDLADMMDDVDWLRTNLENIRDELVTSSSGNLSCDEEGDHASRLNALKLWKWPLEATMDAAVARLEELIGCITSAVVYLHNNNIKHKDLKPSNILISHDGLWLTDFGTASDFSELTQSVTEGGDRGTMKYFAPEVAAFKPSGRSADIFSLGCVFLEMITLINGYTIQETQELRPKGNKSFESNLESINEWFSRGRIMTREVTDEFLMGMIRRMIAESPADRPTAHEVQEEIYMINGFQSKKRQFCGLCCSLSTILPPPAPRTETLALFRRDMNITIGNSYRQLESNRHGYTCFVNADSPDLIDKVHFYLHQSFRRNLRIVTKPPFEFKSRGWGTFEIGICIVLKDGMSWKHSSARPAPGSWRNNMLPMVWDLSFESPMTSDTSTFTIESSIAEHGLMSQWAPAGPKSTQKHPATFQCSLCPKRFTRAYNLRSHLRTHTDEPVQSVSENQINSQDNDGQALASAMDVDNGPSPMDIDIEPPPHSHMPYPDPQEGDFQIRRSNLVPTTPRQMRLASATQSNSNASHDRQVLDRLGQSRTQELGEDQWGRTITAERFQSDPYRTVFPAASRVDSKISRMLSE